MKNRILTIFTITALSACSLYAESITTSDEATLLRQEIQKQELILQALKEKLAAVEKSKEEAFRVTVTSEGLQAAGMLVTIDELEKKLKTLHEDAKIMIQADPSVALKEVTRVMNLCSMIGLKNVAISIAKAEPDASGQRR